MKEVIILISFYITLSLIAQGQTIPYRYYNTSNGLIQSQVTAITQDQNGFIWIGTPGGLNKFDGKRFTRFTERDGLAEDWVTALNVDANGNVWIGHWGGSITVYDYTAGYLKSLKNGKSIDNTGIIKISKDVSGGLWILNKKGELFFYSGINAEPKKVNIVNGLAKVIVNDFEIINNRGFAATNKGIIELNLKTLENEPLKTNSKVDFENITTITFVKKELVGITEYGQFFAVLNNEDNIKFRILNTSQLKTEVLKQIKQLHAATENSFWASTKNKGAIKFTLIKDSIQTEFHDFAHGLSYNETNIVYQDQEGTTWIGTNAGLNQYLGKSFMTLNEWNGLQDNMVHDILVKGNYIYAATDGGLSVIDIRSFKVIRNITTPGLTSVTNNLDKVFCSDKNNVFEVTINSSKPMVKMDYEIVGIRTFNNQLYIATNKGIYLYDNTKSNLVLEGNFYRISSGPSGVYCANVQGEIYLINDNIKKLTYPELESELILAIKEDENRNIWISTYHSGIFKIGPNQKIYNYQLNDENYNYIPFSITVDKTHLWAGTNRGILRLNLQNKQFVVFDEHDGFEGVETNANAVDKADGTLYFGTIMGVCAFNTQFAEKLKNLPKPFLKSVTTFPDNLPIKNSDRIKANNNNIKIEFSAISSTWAKKAEYAYRLLGQDSNWINTNAEEIWFRQLKPGTYVFELQTRVADITNTTETARITFYIKPPFYKTSWFLGLCLLAIGGTLYLIVKNRSRKLYLEKLDLEGQILELNKTLEEKESEIRKLKNEN